eukprot:TRINITY_DN7667_c0_g3_i2.p1 TRINITY_DN7667_c0_g3~~TRINITY_DN7667_c0_g3_i2.p1  ORF type:complete len:448 (-),score=31.78 TRINITY_DN7667_c0_g3_i2:441-1784(-)
MIRPFFFLMICLLILAGRAHAQEDYVWIKNSSGTYTRFPNPNAAWPRSVPISMAQMGVNINAQGKPMINGNSTWVPITGKAGVNVAETIVPSALAVKTVGRVLLRSLPVVGMGLAIYSELNNQGVRYVPDGEDGECTPADEDSKSCGWRQDEEIQTLAWGDPNNGVPRVHTSGQAVCNARAALVGLSSLIYYPDTATSGTCRRSDNSVWAWPTAQATGNIIQSRKAEDSDIEAAIAASSMVNQANLLWESLRSGVPLPLDGSEPHTAVLEKNSVEEESGLIDEKTTQNVDGTSTTTKRYNTTQETGHVTGDTVSTVKIESVKETVVKTVTNNNSTTSPSPTIDTAFTDPSMPGVPELYEQKYPDGLAGVWEQRWPELQATAFIQGITNMFPQLGDGGTCPDWGMSFDIGAGMNYGSHSFSVPCSLWGVLSLIILTTACFSAWRIIFG